MTTNPAELRNEIATLEEQLRHKKAALYHATAPSVVERAAYKLAQKTERKAQRKLRYQTENGITVRRLEEAGCKVRVTHVRPTLLKGKRHDVRVMVPTYLRQFHTFTARGGATFVEIYPNGGGEPICVHAVCHDSDGFDYRMGIKLALERLSTADITRLLTAGEVTLR